MRKKTYFIAAAAITAALYVVLTVFINAFNLANGMIQIRISESLTILPFFTPAAIPGLTVGCVLSNIIMGNPIPDVIFGSLATLIGAIGTYLLSRIRLCRTNWGALLCTIPPVISNGIIIPFVLKYAYELPQSIPVLAAFIVAGEVICCCFGGGSLLFALRETPFFRELAAAEQPSDDTESEE